MSKWTAEDIPEVDGRVAVVTGGNRGLGLAAARLLADAGAHVILAVRSVARGENAAAEILAGRPAGSVEAMALDLADLSSVRAFADAFRAEHEQLDILMNNAGIMAVPEGRTRDGFELQLGVNHLGHFALTGLLIDRLAATPGSRVVNVSSMAARSGRMRWDDPHHENGYDRFGAYGQSKLGNLLFTVGLQDRLAAAGADTISVAAHPGLTATDLQEGIEIHIPVLTPILFRLYKAFAMNAAKGALSQVRAAVDGELSGGEYYGPKYRVGGYPVRVDMPDQVSRRDADRLWEMSEEMTGVRYDLVA